MPFKQFLSRFKDVNPESGIGVLGTLGIIAAAGAVGSGLAWIYGGAAIQGLVQSAYVGTMDVVITFFQQLAAMLLDYSSGFLLTVLGPSFTAASLTTCGAACNTYNLMWANCRDLADMLIVIGFVFVGIATILRIQDYEAKKLLPKLILVAIFINFSGLACDQIYSVSNTVQNAFLNNGATTGISALSAAITTYSTALITEAHGASGGDIQTIVVALGAAVGALIVSVFAAYVFTILAVLLAARWVVLIVFYILSPLAFFAYIFPFTKKYWTQWWTQFLQWCFIGSIAGFLIYLSVVNFTSAATPGASQFFISFVFLYMAYTFTRKSGAVGAGAIMGAAAAVAAFSVGAVGKGAQLAGGAVAGSNVGQKLQTGATRFSENTLGRVGIGPAPGTANLMQAKQNEQFNSSKRIDTLSAADVTRLAGGRAISAKGQADKLAAIQKMAKDGRLGELNAGRPGGLDAAMSFAQGRGVTGSMLSGDDYRAAGFDNRKIQNVIANDPARVAAVRAAHGYANDNAAAAHIARQEQLEQNIGKMSTKQRQNIDVADINEELMTSDKMNAGIIRDFRTASVPHRAALARQAVPVRTAARAAHAAGNTAEFNRLNAVHTEIRRLP
jgi:hypothetical protein